MIEWIPEILVKLFHLHLLSLRAIEDVVPHEIHSEQGLSLRVQSLKNYLCVIIFSEYDDNQFHTVEECGKHSLKTRFDGLCSIGFIRDGFGFGSFITVDIQFGRSN